MPTKATTWSDAELVFLARDGHGHACEELVRRYLRPARAAAHAILQNVADAEDVAQEALATALERITECRIPERFGSWLIRGVRNRALNWKLQLGYRARLLDGLPRDEHAACDDESVLIRRRLLAALDQIPGVQREVMVLHDLESWTHAEIAAGLQISVVMSRQHLFQARKAVRSLLGESGE